MRALLSFALAAVVALAALPALASDHQADQRQADAVFSRQLAHRYAAGSIPLPHILNAGVAELGVDVCLSSFNDLRFEPCWMPVPSWERLRVGSGDVVFSSRHPLRMPMGPVVVSPRQLLGISSRHASLARRCPAFCGSISEIVCLSTEEEVRGVDAGGVIASVADKQPARVNSVVQVVRKAMGPDNPAAYSEHPITGFVSRRGPDPTIAALVDLSPEVACICRHSHMSASYSYFTGEPGRRAQEAIRG